MSISKILGVNINKGGAPAFDADYQAILDYATAQGYTLPSAGQQTLQNNLLVALKTNNIWNKLHLFRIYATDGDEDFATLNWKNPAVFQAIRVNAATFITNQGYQGDGVSSVLNTPDYNLNTEPTLNNWGVGVFIHTATTAGDAIMGSSQNNFIFRADAHSSQFNSSKIQQTNISFNSIPPVDTRGTGFIALYRTAPDAGYMANDSQFEAVTLYTPSTLDTGFLRELYRFNVFSNAIHSATWVGEPIITEHSDFKAAIQNYIDSL